MKDSLQVSSVGLTEEKSSLQRYISSWGQPISGALLLDPIYKIFQPRSIEGAIGYRLEGECAIVLGDPLCAPSNLAALVEAFHNYCEERHLSIIYLVVTESFAQWALETHTCKIQIDYGDLHLIDPVNFDYNGPKGSLLRHKRHRAIRDHVFTCEYVNRNPAFEEEAKKIEKAWLDSRTGPQIYISHQLLFSTSPDRRWFYAVRENKIIGVLLLCRVEAYQGWQVYHCMAMRGAPPGTTEYLILTAIETLRNEGCRYFMLATTAAHQLSEVKGMGVMRTWMSRLIYKMAHSIFSLDKKRKYWDKFHAQKEHSYILFSRSTIGLTQLKGLLKALNVKF